MTQDIERLEIQKIEQNVNVDGKRVLEIGCGDGRVTALYAANAKRVVAIDPDEELIRKARATGQYAEFRGGVGESLEFAEASFDVVLFTFSLHHHQNSRLALQEAYRVLTDEGQVLILEPSAEGDIEQIFTIFHDETQDLETARKNIEQSPFHIEHQDTFSLIWTFDDAEDLYHYDFDDRHRQPDQAVIRKKINALVGAKINDWPLCLEDKTMLYLLRK